MSSDLTATTTPPEPSLPRAALHTRIWRVGVGEPELAPLSIAHAFAGLADAFVTVSLAGSLFFNLSPDASRKQVLLYLIVTVAPLAVLAPLIGPTVDRFRHKLRFVAGACFAIRALFCLALAATLFQLSFYGFALGLLVVGKASGIVKQALIPLIITDPDQLVSANARISRLGSFVGGIGGAVGALLLHRIDATGLLRGAAIAYVCSTIAVWRVRPPSVPEPVLSEVEYAEMHLPSVVVGSVGVMAIRAAVGFFVFTLAFTLRRASEPAWVYGAAVVVYGGGAYLGSVLAPWLRKRFQDSQLIALAIAAPTLPTLIGILGVSRPLLLAIACLIGVSTTLGRHAFDSLLQHRAPSAMRGRAAARYETRFQLVWALGAVIATPISLPPEASMAVLTALYLPALIVYLRASNAAAIFEETSQDAFGRAERRLVAAELSLDGGEHRVSVVDAAAAVDLARLSDPAIGAQEGCAELERLRALALDPAGTTGEPDAARAVELAGALLSLARPRSPVSPRTSRWFRSPA
ncbi:MAG: Major Facilitator Superfamily transporter [Ilumatobacteraceae bacterium]|nr:Major Facilitator Superfamily transporter [Ilumatobacteraceae bacterium]